MEGGGRKEGRRGPRGAHRRNKRGCGRREARREKVETLETLANTCETKEKDNEGRRSFKLIEAEGGGKRRRWR